jgi:3-hydroxyisobutyrate dehydrogenase
MEGEKMDLRVGLIGLGRMGSGMGLRILAAPFPLAVCDLHPDKALKLVEAGAVFKETPAELAQDCPVVILSLPNTHAVEGVLFAEKGLAGVLQPGSVVVDTSTISPLATQLFAQKLGDKGIEMLDAPVSGGSEGARKGSLSMMVGGSPAALEKVRPVLSALASSITPIGESGMGQAVKMVNQVILVGNIMAMSEGILLAKHYGLDLSKMLQAVQGGAAGSWMLTNLAPKVIVGDYSPSFTIELMLKDLRIALETADQLGVPLTSTAQIFQLYRSIAAQGHAQDGNHALIQALEALTEGIQAKNGR